jgi:hypothetical protein
MANQLVNPSNFKVENIVFSKNKHRTIADKNIAYQTMKISYRNNSGIDDLVLETPVLYSFGVQPNWDDMKLKNKINNYSQTICLHSTHGATKEELAFETMIKDIVDACKLELLRQKVKYKGYPLQESDLRHVTLFKYPKDKATGEFKTDMGPRLNIRLADSRFSGDLEIKALYYDTTGKPLDPIEVGRCRVKMCFKVDSIFINQAGIYIQVRVQEAYVDIIDGNIKPRLTLSNVGASFGTAPPPPIEEPNDETDEKRTPKRRSPKVEKKVQSDSEEEYSSDMSN